jgi:hypothetical protein
MMKLGRTSSPRTTEGKEIILLLKIKETRSQKSCMKETGSFFLSIARSPVFWAGHIYSSLKARLTTPTSGNAKKISHAPIHLDPHLPLKWQVAGSVRQSE